MAVKKSYNRYFIIFQEEDRGFGIAIDKQPTGYTKIENRNGKCKITVYAQNLLKERGPYFCCLIDSTKDPLVVARLGALNIDEAGRGETWWEYKEDDIADTLVPFDRFNIATIITEDQRINAPLAGYIGKDKVTWKERMPLISKAIVEEEKDKVVNNKEPIQAAQERVEEVEQLLPQEENNTELEEEAKKFKEYEEELQSINDNEKVDKVSKKELDSGKEDINSNKQLDNQKLHINTEKIDIDNEEDKNKGKRHVKAKGKENCKDKDKDKDNIKPIENLKENSIKENKVKEAKYIKTEEKNQDEKKAYSNDDSYELVKAVEASEAEYEKESDFFNERKKEQEMQNIHERPFATMFHDILEDFEEEKDISDSLEDVRWWRVPLNDEFFNGENIYYPYYCAIYHLKMAYPYINYIKYFNKLGFYHFGIKYDSNGEVKYVLYGIEGGNMPETQPYMGMTGFIRWMKMKNSDKGMWIMYYNPHTGCIMIPKKR